MVGRQTAHKNGLACHFKSIYIIIFIVFYLSILLLKSRSYESDFTFSKSISVNFIEF